MKKNNINPPHKRETSMYKAKGFTLIELMIAVAIIGILTVLVVPSYQEYVLRAKRTDGKIALTDMADKQERYYSLNNGYAASIKDLYGSEGDQFSPKELYTLTIESGNANAFLIVATAKSEQQADSDCKKLTYNQAGTKTPVACWN